MAPTRKLPEPIQASIDSLCDAITEAADDAQQLRHVPPSLVESFRKAGLFRLWLPGEVGGGPLDFTTMLLLAESVSTLDGSIGWVLTIGATSAAFAGMLTPHAMQRVFERPDAVVGGSIVPRGTATVVEGGYRVSGQWPLASGCQHTTSLVAMAQVTDNGEVRTRGDGAPEVRGMVLPTRECQIFDNWDAPGLRGTGSHDFKVDDLFLPTEMTIAPWEPSLRTEPLYRLPVEVLLAYPIAAVALGIARGSLDTFEGMARAGRKPSRSTVEVRSRTSVQAEVAKAEAALQAARSFYFEVADELYAAAERDQPLNDAMTARMLLARARAAAIAKEVTDSMFQLAGSAAIYAPNRLERNFRDAHVAAQHGSVAPSQWERAGRHFLGLEMGR